MEGSNLEFKTHTNYKDFNRLKYLEKMSQKGAILVLRVLNSATLAKDTIIKINAQGVEGSLRGRKDGVTYFGSKKKARPFEDINQKPEIVNDYVIRNTDVEINNKHRGRHFQIEYCIDSNSYKMRDLGVGFGVFARIDQPLILRDNHLVSMGTSFLIINMDEEDNESVNYGAINEGGITARGNGVIDEIKPFNKTKKKTGGPSEIVVKIFGGPNYGEIHQFDSTVPVIKIGRMQDCELRIDDALLSKYQGSIKYVPSVGWTLFDGYNDKPSTNSNWLYLNEDFELYHGMTFKANHTLFQVEIYEQPQGETQIQL